MGWASGSYLAAEVWDEVRKYIPENKRKKLATKLVDMFNSFDADDWDPEQSIVKDAGLYSKGGIYFEEEE